MKTGGMGEGKWQCEASRRPLNGCKGQLVWPALIGWVAAGPGPKSRSTAGDFQEQDSLGPGRGAPGSLAVALLWGRDGCFGETAIASASGLSKGTPVQSTPYCTPSAALHTVGTVR